MPTTPPRLSDSIIRMHPATATPAAPVLPPTPWTYQSADGIYDAHGVRIAALGYRQMRGCSMSVPAEQKEAYGRLLAAAPELRDALAAIVDLTYPDSEFACGRVELKLHDACRLAGALLGRLR